MERTIRLVSGWCTTKLKTVRIAALLLIFCAASAIHAAEVRVYLTSKVNQFVPGEQIPLNLRIENFSGKSFQIGDSPDWLGLRVESPTRSSATQLSLVRERITGTVPNAEAGKLTVNLTDYYMFTDTGKYKVRAYVKTTGLEPVFMSYPDFEFDIVPATTIWEMPIGYVPVGQPQLQPLARTFAVQKITRARTKIYVRVSGTDTGELISMIPLGELVTSRRSVKRIDRLSNLHILHQSGAHEFSYHTIAPDGKLLRRRTYGFANRRAPVLEVNDSGIGEIVSGLRIVRPETDVGRELKLPDALPPIPAAQAE
ncbi:MAG: hypothetical protein ACJASX_001269 [Limisphaerales bacterium]|jgi:hypothetical protein